MTNGITEAGTIANSESTAGYCQDIGTCCATHKEIITYGSNSTINVGINGVRSLNFSVVRCSGHAAVNPVSAGTPQAIHFSSGFPVIPETVSRKSNEHQDQ